LQWAGEPAPNPPHPDPGGYDRPPAPDTEYSACFTFIRWYLAPFAHSQNPDKLSRIVAKTARKMSADARALAECDMPAPLAAHFAP